MVAQRAALGGGGRISPSGRKHSSRLWWLGASSCRQPRRMPAGNHATLCNRICKTRTQHAVLTPQSQLPPRTYDGDWQS